MIRSTVNEGIISASKLSLADVGRGESIELVLAGIDQASAINTEVKDIDARAAFQTQTPSNRHNGPKE